MRTREAAKRPVEKGNKSRTEGRKQTKYTFPFLFVYTYFMRNLEGAVLPIHSVLINYVSLIQQYSNITHKLWIINLY